MPYVAPSTVVTATTITSAWGNSVKSATDFLANPPACRVYHNTTQSLTTAVETPLIFNSERWDTDAMHDTVTNNGRITFNTAGLYVIGLNVNYAANTVGTRYTSIRLNGGATYLQQDTRGASPTLGTLVNLHGIYKAVAGDYILAYAYQTSGGALNVTNGTALIWSDCDFWATWIGLG